MFAYLVKRLLSGLLVVLLVSMMVFALFWYGPKSPAQPICDARHAATAATQRRGLEEYEERLGYNNPIYEEYGKWLKGVFVGRDDHSSAPPRVRLPGALPRPLLPDQQPGQRDAQGSGFPPRSPRHRRCLPLPPDRRHHRRGRRPKTRHASPTRRWSSASCSSARSPTTCSPCWPCSTSASSYGLLRTSATSRSPTAGSVGWFSGLLLPGSCWASSAARSTPDTPAARWSSRSARTTSAPPRPRA